MSGLTKWDMEKEATQRRIAEQLARIADQLDRLATHLEPNPVLGEVDDEELAKRLDAVYIKAQEEK